MAYRTLSLRAPCARISALSARSSSSLTTSYSMNISSRPFPPRLLSSSTSNHPQSTSTTSQPWVNWKALKKVGVVVGIAAGAVTIVLGAFEIPAYIKGSREDGKKSQEGKSPVLGYIPRMPGHFFQPRTEEVRKVREMFDALEETNPGNLAKTVYITGEPATGKSQLAGQFGREFYERNKPQNKGVFVGTLSADNRSNFLDTYLQIAVGLGCVDQKIEFAIRSGRLDELQSLKMLSDHVKKELRERPEWLLIIDGLSSDERLAKELSFFWPQPKEETWGKGCVLLTTQGHAPTGSCMAVMDLKSGMSEKDAVELLNRESGCSDKEGAVELVNSLDRSPLSVASAGLYIKTERSRKASYSFKNYLETVVQKGAQDMIEQEHLKKGQGPFQHTRKEAVSMAAKQMASNSPNLYKAFVLLAACAQAPVPLSLVARVLGVQSDSRELEDVSSCALLSPMSAGLGDIETVSVHQVTRSVFKDLFLQDVSTSAASEQKNVIIHITDCMCQEFDTVSNNIISSSDSVTPFQMMKLLFPHIETLLKIHSDFCPDAGHEVKLRYALGQSYRHMGRYMEAREVLEKALVVGNEEGIKETREGAGIAKELGWIYIKLGMFTESEHILKEALGTFTKLYGEDSVEVAEVLNYLGGTYYKYSQLKNSRECFERALEIHEKLYGHKHPSVASVLGNLGNVCEKEGDKAKAISHYQEALTIQEEIHGPNHLKVAFLVHNLGFLSGGEHGIDLLKRALQIEKKVCGEDHPEVASTLIGLSYLYRDLGDIQNAKKMAQDAFLMLQNIHNLPLMATAQHILGMIHLELEEFDQAQKHLQNSSATYRAVYGVKDKNTMGAHLGIAMAARLAGNLQQAKEILETAEDSLLDAPDTLRLIELSLLGKVYLDLGYLTKSLQVHSRALDVAKGSDSGKAAHQIAFRRADLAKALWESGEVRSGLEMMQHALKEYQQSTDRVSKDDSVTKPELEYRNTEHVSMLVTISQMLEDTGNLEEARGFLEDALQKLSQSYLPHNLVKAKSICSLGTVFNKLAAETTTTYNPVAAIHTWYYRYKARKQMNTALDIMRKVCNAHPNTATILAAIGRLDLESGYLHSAKLHLEEAMDIQTKCCGSIHPNIALYHQLLAEVASQTGDELSAKSHSQEADKIHRDLIKRECETSEMAGIKLPILQRWQDNIGKSFMRDEP